MNIFLILGIVFDTFLITACNGRSIKDNLSNYLGMETLSGLTGFIIGSLLLQVISGSIIKITGGVLIILLQILNLSGFEFPDKVNAALIGVDSLIIFSTLEWFYIPCTFVFELMAILTGTLLGSRIVKFMPGNKYYANIIMVLIGLTLIGGA